MNITVNGQTRLEFKGTRQGITRFAEFYANWETGNQFEVPEGTNEATVIEVYKATFVTV